jgi:hypothetical protein
VSVSDRGKIQRRRIPFLKISGSFICHIIFDRGYPVARKYSVLTEIIDILA